MDSKIRGLEYSISGEGRPFIWSHGFLLSREVENQVAELDWQMLSRAARLIRYDVKGHGDSDAASSFEAYQWNQLGQDLLDLASQLGAKNFVAGGQSLGCATAIYSAMLNPERVQGLVLLTPPTAWATRAGQTQMYAQLAGLVRSQGVPSLVEMLRKKPIVPPWLHAEQPRINDIMLKGISRFDKETLAQIFEGMIRSDLPDLKLLSSLQMPTLILAWEDDPGHPIETAHQLAKSLPKSELIVAKTWKEVQAWTPKIVEFLNKF